MRFHSEEKRKKYTIYIETYHIERNSVRERDIHTDTIKERTRRRSKKKDKGWGQNEITEYQCDRDYTISQDRTKSPLFK